jgi:biopolymer transport protein ExbD
MSTPPRRARFVAALSITVLLALPLAGCDRAPPRPVPHVQLHIAADGSLQLDHQPVRNGDALTAWLSKRQQGQPPLMVEIHASPQADMRVVQAAAHAVEAAHARVSFTDEYPASAPVDGR